MHAGELTPKTEQVGGAFNVTVRDNNVVVGVLCGNNNHVRLRVLEQTG